MIKHTRPIRQVVHHEAPQYLQRSILGMIKIYNWLPQRIVDRATVKEFQSELQLMIVDAVTCQHNWIYLLDHMHAFFNHPLRRR